MSAPIPDARSAEHWFQEAWDPEMSLGDWWQVLALSGWGFPTWPERWFGRGLDSQEARRVQAARASVGAVGPPSGIGVMMAGPAIIASKHQSAWETLTFHALIPDVAVGLKEELTRIPVFGWYLLRAGNIKIDRGAGSRAIRSLIEGAKRAAADGLCVLIFPEGTRRAPGDPPDYKPGVAALYGALRLPVVPVALNSGMFWRRREFTKHPGRIVVEFLEPIPAGLDRKHFMARLERAIEDATARLVAEVPQDRAATARAGQPPALPL